MSRNTHRDAAEIGCRHGAIAVAIGRAIRRLVKDGSDRCVNVVHR
jgi:hypothetical protein